MEALKIWEKAKSSIQNLKSFSVDNTKKNNSNLAERVNQFQTGLQITGQLVSLNSCYFNGKINGNIEIHNKLVLGENSEVVGDVFAKELLVKGKVIGNIIVENKLTLSKSSSINSKSLHTALIEVENGAELNVKNLVMQSQDKLSGLFPKLPEFEVKEQYNEPLNVDIEDVINSTEENNSILKFLQIKKE